MSVVRVINCDILVGQNDVEPYGFDKNKTLGEMLDLAILHKSPILIKNGKGKWYLKGKGRPYEALERSIKNNKPMPRRVLYFIKL